MAHQYLHPIDMTLKDGQPVRFSWRGSVHAVAEVLAFWRLCDGWWEPASAPLGASERDYYRIRCFDGLICDVYYDAATKKWMLDRVHD
jgi:hypothetical protein